ncbi:MAG: patatin-like phospholipase family protein [Bryobacteraceae bacterium]|nr:patatin-like phospholipase family protein [Bryobacteraceae bacterium]
MRHWKAAAAGVLLLAAAAAAEPEARPRKKVGLALSGGSALGLAHIGVIQWLEEQRIPVDFLAGTSMGALVGGLYATGRDGGEIERFVRELDWSAAFEPSVPFRHLAFRRKEDRRDFPSTIEFGIRKGLKLPPGVSAGHGAGLAISRFAAAYDSLASFDELPTPFRCVATDLKQGREVVFAKGPLTVALRASMSLPALFAPVELDGMLLVDGGLLNNLPVDVARQMGADVVIAVALDRPYSEDRITSLVGVAGRSISVMVAANERRSMGLADLVLMPDLTGLEPNDYAKAGELIRRGREAAQRKAMWLAQLAVPEEEYERYLAERRRRQQPETVKPQRIEVQGVLAEKRRRALVEALAADPKRPLDRQRLETELNKIAGMGRYDAVSYSLLRDGQTEGLVIRPHAKTHGPPFLNLAFLLDASRQEGFRFGLGGRLTFLDIGGPASEWRTDLLLGPTQRAASEYYWRIGGGKWFLAPQAFYGEETRPLYRRKDQIAEFITWQGGAAMDAGYAFGRFQELRVGMATGRAQVSVTKAAEEVELLRGRFTDVHVRWAYEGQDSALVPRRGVRATLRGSWLLNHPGVEGRPPLGEATLSYARPLGPRWSLLADTAGGMTGWAEGLNSRFAVGGAGRLDALNRARETGNRYYYGGVRVLRTLASEPLGLLGRFHLFAAAESGRAWRAGASPLPRWSGSAGLLAETAFGVVYLGGGAGDRGDRRLFFRLGRVF